MTARICFNGLHILALCALLADQLSAARGAPQPGNGQTSLEVMGRNAQLEQLSDGTTPGAVAAPIVLAALQHSNPSLRSQGLEVFMGWLGRETLGVPVADSTKMRAMRPIVVSLLRDTDDDVRWRAVQSLVVIDAVMPRRNGKLRIPESTHAELVSAYRTESTVRVRVTIIGQLAQSDGPTTAQTSGILEALADTEEMVVAQALWGVGNLQIATGMRTAAEMVSHSNAQVKSAALIALGKFGNIAQPVLPLLQRALDAETDPATRRMIEGTMGRISRK
jgi:hypothetical protein